MRMDEFKYLLRRSQEFYESAVMQFNRGFYGLAAFSLEQSLQLLLKAKLLECGAGYPRVHGVRRLLSILSEIIKGEGRDALMEVLRRYSLELALLEDVYITARYVPKEFTAEDVRKLRKVVDEVMRVVGGITC